MAKLYYRYIFIIAAIMVSIMRPDYAYAFSTDTYTTSSALSSGRWIKISVAETGMHFISASTLKSWGFSDVSKVKIHGYGGKKIPDQLTIANYIDDLPEVATYRNPSGIYFYGVGPVEWKYSSKRYSQSLNPFSDAGFYFLTQNDDTAAEVKTESSNSATQEAVTEYEARTYHEIDRYSLSHSGTSFLGEDFRIKKSQSFNFDLPDLIEGRSAWLRVSFVTNTNKSSNLDIAVNGTNLPSTNTISQTPDDNYGVARTFTKTFTPTGEDLKLDLTFRPSGTVSAAHLDGITINYMRHLRMRGSSPVEFTLSSTKATLDGASESTRVWDVTNPVKPIRMQTTLEGGKVTWTNPYTGTRNYVAWNENSSFPTPKMVSSVPNQNLHGITDIPDMVIFTIKDFAGEAERVANLHRNAPDNLSVIVVTQDDVFNEFASGCRDAGAFRRMLKMLYDRGNETGQPLRYCLFFGHPSFDPRQLTDEVKSANEPFMPVWQTEESLSGTSSYTSDDVLCMLEDNSGNSIPYDRICIAAGRIPARSLTQAKNYVDKLYSYAGNRLRSEWKNTVILEADNGNDGVFMVGNTLTTTGMEGLYNAMMAHPDASQFIFNKIYYDAYNIIGGVCEKADELFTRSIDEGTMFWIYNGHAAISSLGGEGLHTLKKLSDMSNRHNPVLFALTCSFGQWDNTSLCGTERLSFNPDGGTIAAISSTRKVQITSNDAFIVKVGENMLQRDESGQYMRIGDMLKNAKNALRDNKALGASTVKLCYVLLGDPAMRLNIPSGRIEIDDIDGEEVTPESQTTLMARQRVRLSGSLYDKDGNPMDDFNGTLSITLYDAETSVTTLGLDVDKTTGKAVTYDEKGEKLFTGRGTVVNGRFTTAINMPSEISDNFRPATINLYATSDDGREAMGVSRDIYVFGYDYTVEPDTIAPEINYAYLNHPSFVNGSIVNEQPVFMAGVTDDTGINLSMAGIGHQMSLKLDDNRTFTDLSLYYTPSSDGSPSGTISYPVNELADGNHTLTFRVWDTSGNSASRSINFFVEHGAAPQIFDVFTDANPASTHANFYMSHNRPDAQATVRLDIYSLSGRHVWSSTVSGRSDMFLSTPIQWNLCDMGGQRVIRGIYIYRASITIDGHEIQAPSKRIAVTGR